MSNEDDVCRVCRCGGSVDNPLFFPCKCSGSIRFVHQDCLETWLARSSKRTCEMYTPFPIFNQSCQYAFQFTALYSPEATDSGTIAFYMKALARRFVRAFLRFLRCLSASVLWLIIVPAVLALSWKVFFEPVSVFAILFDPFSAAYSFLVPGQHPATPSLMASFLKDKLVFGQVMLGVSVTLIVVFLFARELIVIHQEDAVIPDVENELRVAQERLALVAEQRINWEERQRVLLDLQFRYQLALEQPEPDLNEIQVIQDEINANMMEVERNERVVEMNEPGANQPELVLAEIFGFAGNPFTVMLSVGVFCGAVFAGIGVFVWLPFTLGRLFRLVFSEMLVDGWTSLQLSSENVLDRSVDWFLQVFGIAAPLKQAAVTTVQVAASVSDASQYTQYNDDQLMNVATGYALITTVLLVLTSALASTRPAILPIFNRIKGHIEHSFRFVKLLFFLQVEMLVFPFFCGCLIDLCAVPLVSHQVAEVVSTRIALFNTSPYSFTFIHWIIGTFFMYHFSNYITVLRKILRPGVLWFVRDPTDPNFQPIRDIMHKSAIHQIKKLCRGILMYAFVQVWLFGGLSLLACLVQIASDATVGYKFLPLRVNGGEGVVGSTTIVFLMVYFICASQLAKLASPSSTFMAFQRRTFRTLAKPLRLSWFLFNDMNPDEMNNDAVDADGLRSVDTGLIYMQVPFVDHVKYRQGDQMMWEIGQFEPMQPRNVRRDDIDVEDDEGDWANDDELLDLQEEDGLALKWIKVGVPRHFRLVVRFAHCSSNMQMWVFALSVISVTVTAAFLLLSVSSIIDFVYF